MSEIVIIIGAARSGTKVLRDVLAASPAIAAVPYDINFAWRIGNQGAQDDVLDETAYDANARIRLRRAVYRAAKLRPGSDRILLEKTVSNALRIPFVRQVFPEARFIHLIRDGRDVVESSMRMWQAPLDNKYLLRKLKYVPWSNIGYIGWFVRNRLRRFASRPGRGQDVNAIWGPRYSGIEGDLASLSLARVCARQWRRCVESATRDLGGLASGEVLEVRYEDLVRDENVVARVAEFAGVSDVSPVVKKYTETIRGDLGGRWRQLDEADMAEINDEIEKTLIDLGYSERSAVE